jgi:cobalt-zinc-cadmium efflux system outer membrane protein
MLQQYALAHRADLKALELEAEALGLKYKVEKRERLPDLNVNFGYKNQSDGSEGFVIGGGIQLPIFNRNSGNITMAEAKHRSVETSLHIQKRNIRNQVDVAYQRVQSLYAQWQDMQQNPLSAEMLETSRLAYQEGRYSLVELLDATKAYVDGRSLQHRITADYQQALFTLDTITSGKIFSTQKTSEQ